jgi:apolipoprotein N-acyltransferase
MNETLPRIGSRRDGSSFFGKTSWITLPTLSAALLNCAFPYPGFSFLAWVALAPLFVVVLTEKRLGKVLGASAVAGFLFNIVYLLWMKEYKHPASLSGGVFSQMLFFSFAVLLSRVLSRATRRFKALALALGWCAVDYVKTIGFLGFPWGILGYSQYKNILLIQTASVFGVWGIDALVLYANAILAALIAGWDGGGSAAAAIRSRAFSIWALCALFAASAVYGVFAVKGEEKAGYDTKRVALIQTNFDPWSPRLKENLDREIELTREALARDPDLIVWSESSVPFPYQFYLERNNRYARLVHDFIVSVKKPFLIGTLEFEGSYENGTYDGDWYNVAVFYGREGLQGSYRKIHLVPFGEWFPFDRVFPFVKKILEDAGTGDFVPGTEFTVFDAGSFRFSALVCFEDVFGDLTRRFMSGSGKPGILVNVTNDAWSGSRKAEVQHFSQSVFRAVENRVGLARAANGGVSACVDTCGRVTGSIELFTSSMLVCDVPVGGGRKTFYARHGDLPARVVLSLAGAALLAVVAKKVIDRKRKNHIM